MKQIEYFGKIYDVKEDDVVIGINTFYQIFTKSNNGEYNFLESRNDLFGKVNILPQTMAIASEEPKPHPHADLMLKYAMIAQYDDKPWENFEYLTETDKWVTKSGNTTFIPMGQYRLKPQEPKIQVGQIWVDVNGIEVEIRKLSTSLIFTDIGIAGLIIPWSFSKDYFLQNFKLKENK